MAMQQYIEVQRVREHDIIVDDCITAKANTNAFFEGDVISVTEKLDGLQFQVYYDADANSLVCCSNGSVVSGSNQLFGFDEYVKTLDTAPFEKYQNYIFFGEWLIPQHITYEDVYCRKWYIFSVYDRVNKRYLPQSFVKGFSLKYHFDYPHEYYYGPFRGWDHVLSFVNNPNYGRYQEGIVIKNQTALDAGRGPHILKYINASFEDIKFKHHAGSMGDYAHDLLERSNAEHYAGMLVTFEMIIDTLHDMIDAKLISHEVCSKDMFVIEKHLPSRVYAACQREHRDAVLSAGEYAKSAICTMSIIKAKELLQFI